MNKADKKGRKFKSVEKNAKNAPVKNIEWEGEELQAESTTKIEEDKGTGQAIVIRFFEFGANPEAFKLHKPTEQQLFDSCRKGIEAILWKDELKPFEGIAPRIMFSKNKTHFRIIVGCTPRTTLIDQTRTLSQLLAKSPK